MRALIVDDEPAARRRLVRLLAAHPHIDVVAEAPDGETALAHIDAFRPDVVFLDIRMPGLSGLDVAASVPDPAPVIVFVTAHADYALDAFETAAVDYLVKPVDAVRLARAVTRLGSRIAAHASREPLPAPPRLLVPDRRGVQVVPIDTIAWLEAADNYVEVHTPARSWLIRRTLTGLVDDLGNAFVRVHRSAAVALAAVDRVVTHDDGDAIVVLRGDIEVPCSRQHRAALMQRLATR